MIHVRVGVGRSLRSAVGSKNMSKYIPKNSEIYKYYFVFLKDWGVIKNISYHLQYLEFLYFVKKEYELISTTLSLTNKTIITEFFVIVEAILDSLLCKLYVTNRDDKFFNIKINEYIKAAELFRLCKEYEIINESIYKDLEKLRSIRNDIHIKRYKIKDLFEYEKYSDELIEEIEFVFKKFIEFLLRKHENYIIIYWHNRNKTEVDILLEKLRHFPWPKDNFCIKKQKEILPF